MEKKIQKHDRKQLVMGILGYFAGTVLYSLLGSGEDPFYRLLAGAVVSGIFWMLSDWREARKHPDLLEKRKIEDRDERNQWIRGKAAQSTSATAIMTLFLLLFLGAVLENPWISYGAAAFALLLFATNWMAVRYWNQRM